MRRINCAKCGNHIDRGACGQAFAIITIKDDRANDPKKFKQTRRHLCDGCTINLELWLLGE